nr:MAG TPA: hypothetical protein [Caudoviricetes sp.]
MISSINVLSLDVKFAVYVRFSRILSRELKYHFRLTFFFRRLML